MNNQATQRFLSIHNKGYIILWSVPHEEDNNLVVSTQFLTKVYEEDGVIYFNSINCVDTALTTNNYSKVPLTSVGLDEFVFFHSTSTIALFDKFNPSFTESSIVKPDCLDEVLLEL
jgi:hypothetical protein